MGILKNIINKVVDKRITEHTKGVGTEMEYNHLLVDMGNNFNDKQKLTFSGKFFLF